MTQIFVDGEYVGDEETMAVLEKRGELDAVSIGAELDWDRRPFYWRGIWYLI